MALTSIGAILEWGDNEYGQMGNKKRSVTENPIIVNAFQKDNVFSIACGNLQSGVIIAKDK
jgi:alpha-tubulin suppressor-like RCC1 family protein